MFANKEDGLLYIILLLSLTAMMMLDDDQYQGCQPRKSLSIREFKQPWTMATAMTAPNNKDLIG